MKQKGSSREMKRAAAAVLILFLVLGSIAAAAEKIVVREVVILNTDGTEEVLADQEQIFRRLNIRESGKSLAKRSGLEEFLSLDLIFPKGAEKVYLTFEAPGAVPGDELLVLQNGEKIRGEVTGTDEITIYVAESGQIEIYRSPEEETESVPEDAAEEAEETEKETEAAQEAPATGESPVSSAAERMMYIFAALALISAGQYRRIIKRKD